MPTLELTQEEEEDIETLEARLREYKRIKELSVYVAERLNTKVIFNRDYSREIVPFFFPTKEITIKYLLRSINEVLNNLPKVEMIPQTVVKRVESLEKAIENLTKRIQINFGTNFRDLAEVGKKEKINVIISFLALLELIKRGAIFVNQKEDFGDISVKSGNI